MSILTTLNPLTNADRHQMWCGAFRYLGKADPLFAVRPQIKINLATKTRQGNKPFMTAAGPTVARKRGTDFRGSGLETCPSKDAGPLAVQRSAPSAEPDKRLAPNNAVGVAPDLPHQNEHQDHRIRPLPLLLNVIGGSLVLVLAFAFVVVLGAVMGQI